MSVIYRPHVCLTPESNSKRPNRYPLWEAGTIWQCHECDKYWHFRHMFTYDLGYWRRVRFWNPVANHRIRKARR